MATAEELRAAFDKVEANQKADKVDETGRPKRAQTRVTYIGEDRIVDVPPFSAGDAMDVEEEFDEAYLRIQFRAVVQGWMVWRALHRHHDQAERPAAPFKEWRKKVDQIWDEGDDGVPLV